MAALIRHLGEGLRFERKRAGVKAAELAARLGVLSRRVYEIEGEWRPTAESEARYKRALEEILADRVASLTERTGRQPCPELATPEAGNGPRPSS